ILSKPCRFQPFEPLDAVANHPFPAWEKPCSGDVHAEDGDFTNAMPTATTTRNQSPAAQRASEAIGHDPPAAMKRVTGTPDVGAADAVKDNVDAVTRATVNFFHEVVLSIINRDAAHFGNGRCTL